MLGDILDYLGGSLDKPGRAVRGVLGGHFDEINNLLPFSDSLGITDPGRAVSGEDLFKKHLGSTGNETLDSALGLGTSMALDPLTYMGGAFGRLAGRALGRGAEAAATARGPGYKTTFENLMSGIPDTHPNAQIQLEGFLDNPNLKAALSEIPENSKYLGRGAEAMAFRTPSGDVARMATRDIDSQTRPLHSSMLPSNRTATYQIDPLGHEGIRVERSPFADMMKYDTSSPSARGAAHRDVTEWAKQFEKDGIDYWDARPANVGDYQGKRVMVDPGSWFPLGDTAIPTVPEIIPRPPDKMTQYLLGLLGGQPAMQRALAAGLSAPRYERALGRMGMGGAALGLPEQ